MYKRKRSLKSTKEIKRFTREHYLASYVKDAQALMSKDYILKYMFVGYRMTQCIDLACQNILKRLSLYYYEEQKDDNKFSHDEVMQKFKKQYL